MTSKLELYDYQKRAIEFWLNNPRCYFAIDMGLGKTAATLYALKQINKPALVIAPLTTIYTTWPSEVDKWGLQFEYSIVHGKYKKEALYTKADIYFTNYRSLKFIYTTLIEMSKQRRSFPFEVLVIDEGSKIKSYKTKQFKIIDALLNLFPEYRIILSGTPAPQSYLDLWTQYYVLTDGECLGSQYGKFRSKYFKADDWNEYLYVLRPGAKKYIFNQIKPITFRLDAKDYLNLPDIVYNKIKLTIDKKNMELYNQFKKDFIITLSDHDCFAINSATLSNKLRQILQGFIYYDTDNGRQTEDLHTVKVEALKDLVNSTNQPILCAVQFKHELKQILQAFPGTPVIAGKTKNADKIQYIREWNLGKIPLLICHPASLSHGVNLQSGGNIILWYCSTWSVEQYLQFNARLHRHGQTKGVIVHHLVIENTIDEHILSILTDRTKSQQDLLDFLKDEANY